MHRRFVERMRSLGHHVEAFDVSGSRDDREQQLHQGVLSADAFVLTDLPDVLGTEGLGDLVWGSVTWSIRQWARRLLWLGANQQMNPWLDAFDMQVSNHKLFPPGWDTRPGRAGILRVDDQPGGMSLSGLFAGVEEIRVASPMLLRTGSRAQRLLACPPQTDIVDRGDRFLATDDPGRVCAGYWAPGPAAPPRVLVFSAGCFHDGGLDENLRFARNTIEWVVGHDWSSTVMETAGRYVVEVEVTLRELIAIALQKAVDGAWFEEIPVDVRRKLEGICRRAALLHCASRRPQGDSRDEISTSPSSPPGARLGLRRVSFPARRHHPGGQVVPALRPLLPGRGGAPGRTRHRGRSREHLPVGAPVRTRVRRGGWGLSARGGGSLARR